MVSIDLMVMQCHSTSVHVNHISQAQVDVKSLEYNTTSYPKLPAVQDMFLTDTSTSAHQLRMNNQQA